VKKFNDDELRYFVSKGPFQPTIDFPVNEEFKLRKQTCKFISSLYTLFPYLEYSIMKDRAYCFICRLFGHGVGCEQSELAWVVGINKWNKMKSRGKKKDGKLASHFKSTSHNAALERYHNFITRKNHVDLMLDSRQQQAEQQREAVLKYNRSIVSTLMDISRFLARQNLAFRGRSGAEEEGKVRNKNSFLFKHFVIVLGNFLQLVDLVRRHNSSFDQWFRDSSLRAHQVIAPVSVFNAFTSE